MRNALLGVMVVGLLIAADEEEARRRKRKTQRFLDRHGNRARRQGRAR